MKNTSTNTVRVGVFVTFAEMSFNKSQLLTVHFYLTIP